MKKNPILKCFVSLVICFALLPFVTFTKGQQTQTSEPIPVLERGRWGLSKLVINPQFDEVHPRVGTLLNLAAKTSRGRPLRRLRVVIDASHDGGAWWFPQGPPPFDSKKWHQGVAMANYLRKRGWQVMEVPRETKIANQLKNADIVVRMNEHGGYDESEVAAYRKFVTRGGSLLLVVGFVRPGEAESDTVAKQFGIRFEGVIEESVMRGAGAGNFTQDFNDAAYKIGSIVVKYPKNTQPLAYVNNDRLVMGTFRYGRGKIIFLSSVFPLLHVSQPFTGRLFDELARRRSRLKKS